MDLEGFQYTPVRLNGVCFDKEQDIPVVDEKSRKRKNVTEWCESGN